jgi:hypothetical protein
MKLFEVLRRDESRSERERVKDLLRGLGFTEFKYDAPGSKKIFIITDLPRESAFRKLLENLNGSVRNRDKTADSSVGVVEFRGFQIILKPAKFQGERSAGKENERNLIEMIRSKAKSSPTGSITVVFKSDKKSFRVADVVGATEVSEHKKEEFEDTRMSRKADLDLVVDDGTKVPISVKQDNAEYYDTSNWVIPRLKPTIKRLVDEGEVRFEKIENQNVFRIQPARVAFEATPEEAVTAMFGPDIIKNHGAVVTADFEKSDIDWNEEKAELTIKAKAVMSDRADIPTVIGKVYFIFSNHSKKHMPALRDVIPGAAPGARGVYVRAMPEKAIQSTTKVVPVSDRV